jgi:hypothetical protein
MLIRKSLTPELLVETESCICLLQKAQWKGNSPMSEDCDLVLGRKVQKKAVSEGSVGPRRNNAFAFFCTDFGSSSRTLKENS